MKFREYNVHEGRQWLQRRAQQGDAFAMEQLGHRLLAGDEFPPDEEQGVLWMRRSIGQGNVSALFRLGVYFLDSAQTERRGEGRAMLEQAAGAGSLEAKTELGIRLTLGKDFAPEVDSGKRILSECADAGDHLAIAALAASGEIRPGFAGFRQEGFYMYLLSLSAATSPIGARLRSDAAGFFLRGHRDGDHLSSADLAYLIRRREVEQHGFPTLDELLTPGLQAKVGLAILNQALRLAAGIQCNPDWQQADILVQSLPHTRGIVSWWRDLAQQDDAEGHLVLGWLARHGLIADPLGLTIEERLRRARRGWEAPQWLE